MTARAQRIIAKYPQGRQASAVIPLLDIAQRQSGNWLPKAAMEAVAKMLDCSVRHVYRLADADRMPRPLKLGTLCRWRADEIRQWVAAGCPSTPAPGRLNSWSYAETASGFVSTTSWPM